MGQGEVGRHSDEGTRTRKDIRIDLKLRLFQPAGGAHRSEQRAGHERVRRTSSRFSEDWRQKLVQALRLSKSKKGIRDLRKRLTDGRTTANRAIVTARGDRYRRAGRIQDAGGDRK